MVVELLVHACEAASVIGTFEAAVVPPIVTMPEPAATLSPPLPSVSPKGPLAELRAVVPVFVTDREAADFAPSMVIAVAAVPPIAMVSVAPGAPFGVQFVELAHGEVPVTLQT